MHPNDGVGLGWDAVQLGAVSGKVGSCSGAHFGVGVNGSGGGARYEAGFGVDGAGDGAFWPWYVVENYENGRSQRGYEVLAARLVQLV